MAEPTRVDLMWLEQLTREFHTRASEIKYHTERFMGRSPGVGEAYGHLGPSKEVAHQYLSVVGSMGDYLSGQVDGQRYFADTLAVAVDEYRVTQESASADIAHASEEIDFYSLKS